MPASFIGNSSPFSLRPECCRHRAASNVKHMVDVCRQRYCLSPAVKMAQSVCSSNYPISSGFMLLRQGAGRGATSSCWCAPQGAGMAAELPVAQQLTSCGHLNPERINKSFHVTMSRRLASRCPMLVACLRSGQVQLMAG